DAAAFNLAQEEEQRRGCCKQKNCGNAYRSEASAEQKQVQNEKQNSQHNLANSDGEGTLDEPEHTEGCEADRQHKVDPVQCGGFSANLNRFMTVDLFEFLSGAHSALLAVTFQAPKRDTDVLAHYVTGHR